MSRILLVRHGQASWGAADYDQLSELGFEQARVVGAALHAQGVTPDVVLAGSMKRHGQTAEAACAGAGWQTAYDIDEGWNEFDHREMLARHPAPEGVDVSTDRRAFQSWFEAATRRWTSGEHDDYAESFTTFSERVAAALDRAAAAVPRQGTAVVFTSGGPIAWAVSARLGGDAAVWARLNKVTINASVSTFVVGARGATLLAFNEHTHLAPGQQTYR